MKSPFDLKWRFTIGYLFLMFGVILALYLVHQDQQELAEAQKKIERLQKFDERRAYDLCLSGNERTEVIAIAIKGSAQDGAEAIISAAAFANQGKPQTAEEMRKGEEALAFYRAELERRTNERLKTLKPRDCEALYPKKGR